MRTLAFLPLFLVACGETETSPVFTEPQTEALNAEERFEVAYVGNWSESGTCSEDETVWEIDSDAITRGGRMCQIDDIETFRARLEAELTDCEVDGKMVPDRDILLDVAGEDILYLTNAAGTRFRLEKCPD